jgi:hypothetical protein
MISLWLWGVCIQFKQTRRGWLCMVVETRYPWQEPKVVWALSALILFVFVFVFESAFICVRGCVPSNWSDILVARRLYLALNHEVPLATPNNLLDCGSSCWRLVYDISMKPSTFAFLWASQLMIGEPSAVVVTSPGLYAWLWACSVLLCFCTSHQNNPTATFHSKGDSFRQLPTLWHRCHWERAYTRPNSSTSQQLRWHCISPVVPDAIGSYLRRISTS